MENETSQRCGSEHKDARKGKRRRFLVLLDRGLADAGQMLDDLFGRFAGEIGRNSQQRDNNEDAQADPLQFFALPEQRPGNQRHAKGGSEHWYMGCIKCRCAGSIVINS